MSTFNKCVEEITGLGTLVRGDTVLHDVTYRIRVYQTFRQSSRDAQPIPWLRNVQGYIAFTDDVHRVDLEGQDLTLRLDDGRRLNLQVGPDGRIRTREVLY